METRYVNLIMTVLVAPLCQCIRCHLGRSIVYDTVSHLSWSVDIRTHGIVSVIEDVLSKTWVPSEEIGREVPVAEAEQDCVVSSKARLMPVLRCGSLCLLLVGML
jgi:hypothetical protein